MSIFIFTATEQEEEEKAPPKRRTEGPPLHKHHSKGERKRPHLPSERKQRNLKEEGGSSV